VPASQNGSPLDPTKRRSFIGEEVHIDEVKGSGGPVSLPDLADVDNSVTPGKGSILVGDGSVYQEFPAGADGEVLIYDSTQPFGVRTGTITAAGASIFDFGANRVGNTTTTRYLFPGYAENLAETSSANEMRVPRAGTLKNLYVVHNVLGGGPTVITYTVEVNGVPDHDRGNSLSARRPRRRRLIHLSLFL
jgi:hypothetical protein